jgi:DNA-binding transcriptional regulator PaaX
MSGTSVDEAVVGAIRESGRPVRFGDIAERLAEHGISKSQVHNAVYRLGKRGRIQRSGSGGTMTYTIDEEPG